MYSELSIIDHNEGENYHIKSNGPDIPSIHVAFNPKYHLFVTGGYWSLNSKADVFPVEKRNSCSVIQGGAQNDLQFKLCTGTAIVR